MSLQAENTVVLDREVINFVNRLLTKNLVQEQQLRWNDRCAYLTKTEYSSDGTQEGVVGYLVLCHKNKKVELQSNSTNVVYSW